MFFWRKRPQQLVIYCDGGIGDRRQGTGLGVVIRDPNDEIIGLVKQSLPPMTNNEAEYAALVLALQTVQRFKPRTLQIYMDSDIVVGQMLGRFAVRSMALKRWHSQACRLVRHFEAVTFTHIPRAENRLADALANEALTAIAKKASSEGENNAHRR
jgi:probable phosphoglycerate mutase